MEELIGNVAVESMITSSFNSVRQMVRRLPEIDRAIISMHLDGYENKEVAEAMGISSNNVAVKLHRIKNQLSGFLKAEL